jgi:small subunit ribosomal protein S18
MARSNYRGAGRRTAKDVNRKVKKKPCALCKDHIDYVDYKDVPLLRKYMSDRGKIRSRRVTGNCAQHQRDIALAIKTARELVLLPYTQRTVTERPGGRGGRGREGRFAERSPLVAPEGAAERTGAPAAPEEIGEDGLVGDGVAAGDLAGEDGVDALEAEETAGEAFEDDGTDVASSNGDEGTS